MIASISQQQPSVIKVYGQVSDPKGGKVLLQITKPDGFVERDQAYVTSDGSFYSPVFFTRNSLTGQYRIDVLYQNSNLGSLVLNVKSGQLLLPNQTYAHTNIGVAPSSESNATLST